MRVHTVGDVATLTGSVSTNVTGATLAAHVKRPDGTVVTRTATAVDPLTGTWTSTLQIADLNQAGDYYLEIEAIYPGSIPQTHALDANGHEVMFRVRSQFA